MENGGNYLGGTLYPEMVTEFVTTYAAKKDLIIGNGTEAVIRTDSQLADLLENKPRVPVGALLGMISKRCEEASAFLVERYEQHPDTIAARERCRACNSSCVLCIKNAPSSR